MDLPVNTFKLALVAGRPQIGVWSTLVPHVTAELAARYSAPRA